MFEMESVVSVCQIVIANLEIYSFCLGAQISIFWKIQTPDRNEFLRNNKQPTKCNHKQWNNRALRISLFFYSFAITTVSNKIPSIIDFNSSKSCHIFIPQLQCTFIKYCKGLRCEEAIPFLCIMCYVCSQMLTFLRVDLFWKITTHILICRLVDVTQTKCGFANCQILSVRCRKKKKKSEHFLLKLVLASL